MHFVCIYVTLSYRLNKLSVLFYICKVIAIIYQVIAIKLLLSYNSKAGNAYLKL